MKPRILFIGEHPFGSTGNSNMMRSVIGKIDLDLFDISVMPVGGSFPTAESMLFHNQPFPIADFRDQSDQWCSRYITPIISSIDFNILFMVGIDLWRYSELFPKIADIRDQRGFKWTWLFPYELQFKHPDYIEWANSIDYPLVYSEYGYDMLKDSVENIQYFRPPMAYYDIWKPMSRKEKISFQTKTYQRDMKNTFIFGYVGGNQVRKDPQKLIKAFAQVHKQNPDTLLYMHTDMRSTYNLPQYQYECGLPEEAVKYKNPNQHYTQKMMRDIYCSFDAMVLPSIQEGLSWTPLEAMLCGVPVIATDSTSHKEILSDCGILIPCEIPSYLEIKTKTGHSQIDTFSCSATDLAVSMKSLIRNKDLRNSMIESGRKKALKWLEGVSSPGKLVDSIRADAVKEQTVSTERTKKDAVLFAQYGSGGDVLMSTQCFKGIKEKHKGMELHYMTQKSFMGIVENNPYIDKLVEWDEEEIRMYPLVYNPHREKILPGGWNNLDVTLHSMYPYFSGVEADEIHIDTKKVEGFDFDDYVVINTGGASMYRKYIHMDKVFYDFDKVIVLVGGPSDPGIDLDNVIDLRGKLTYAESAWVVKNAKACIAVDSFVAHLAGAVGTPSVILFGPAPARVTQPRFQKDPDRVYNEDNYGFLMEPDMLEVCNIISHCWSTPVPGKQRCVAPCINTINPLEIRDNLNLILGDES